MNAAQARWAIDQLEARTRSRDARIRMAEIALRIGRLTEEGRAVYREYLLRLHS